MRLNRYGEGLFALLPVAGAELIGLKRIKYAQHLQGVASYREVVNGNEPDDVVGIDDESGALCHALLGIQNTERGAEIAFDVGQHGKGKVPEVGMVRPPGVVDEFAVGAASQQLRVAVLKFAVELTECCDFGGAHE